MLDNKFIRENPEKLKEIIKNKGTDATKANVDRWLELDKVRLNLIQELEAINRKRNEIAEKLQADAQRTPEVIQEGKDLKEQEQELKEKLRPIDEEWQEIGLWFPNIPAEDTVVGKDEYENKEVYAWRPDTGEIKDLVRGFYTEKHMPQELLNGNNTFEPKNHLEILDNLGLVDFPQGAKVAGTRFTYVLGDLVRLQLALQNFLLDYLFTKGFTPIIPPLLVKERAMVGTGHFPEQRDQAYEIKNDYVEEGNGLFLVGSSEPTNFAFFMDKVLKEEELPSKLVAITPCFRTEVGSWGKDTKGLKRLHQFDKLEMDVVCTPEQSETIYEELLDVNKWLLEALKLPYHIVEKCTGDSGYSATHRQADPEIWMTVQKQFMEMGTATNTTDYQARRMNINFIDKQGNRRLCHTVNDTGVAFGRMLAAIAEHYQQEDGTIKVPEVLVTYLGKEYIGK